MGVRCFINLVIGCLVSCVFRLADCSLNFEFMAGSYNFFKNNNRAITIQFKADKGSVRSFTWIREHFKYYGILITHKCSPKEIFRGLEGVLIIMESKNQCSEGQVTILLPWITGRYTCNITVKAISDNEELSKSVGVATFRAPDRGVCVVHGFICKCYLLGALRPLQMNIKLENETIVECDEELSAQRHEFILQTCIFNMKDRGSVYRFIVTFHNRRWHKKTEEMGSCTLGSKTDAFVPPPIMDESPRRLDLIEMESSFWFHDYDHEDPIKDTLSTEEQAIIDQKKKRGVDVYFVVGFVSSSLIILAAAIGISYKYRARSRKLQVFYSKLMKEKIPVDEKRSTAI